MPRVAFRATFSERMEGAMFMEWTRNGLILTDDLDAVDLDFVETMLRESYWAASRPRSDIERSVAASLNFVVLADGQQVGYARVVTDSVTFAWIADVIVAPDCNRSPGKAGGFQL